MFPWSPVTNVELVKGVTISVGPGEIIALIGQSGSGKDNIVPYYPRIGRTDIRRDMAQSKRWDGLSEVERRKLRHKYQYIPQDAMAALNPQQTALEHIVETYRVLGGESKKDAIEKSTKLLTDLGLGERLHALPREMSGGEQRRVTLARVLSLDPVLS